MESIVLDRCTVIAVMCGRCIITYFTHNFIIMSSYIVIIKGLKLMMLIMLYQIVLQHSNAQFPESCVTSANLMARRCCPHFDNSECGSDNGRGQCESITLPSNHQSVRDKWPYYFDHVCTCNNNFSGYNCGKCKYGHYGENCNKFEVIVRRPISDYTSNDWDSYVKILEMAKKYSSGYKIFLTEGLPNLDDTCDISLYDLFVWQHHYTAKDSENQGMMVFSSCI